MSTNLPATITDCTRCGAEVKSGARYCQNCGQDMKAANRETPTYATPPAPMPSTMVFPDSDGGIGKLFSATGRIGRLEYFLTIIGVLVTAIAAWGLLTLLGLAALGFLAGAVLWLVGWIVSLLAGIKRLHDFDQSGWLILLSFVPFAGFILLLLLLFKGPSQGLNRFGYAGSGSPF